jgi:hypothetical protein
MNAQINHDHVQVEEDQRQPDGLWVLLHGVALAVVGVICRGLGAVFARIQGWVAVHVCDAESRWVRRGTYYNQRAFRVIRPWWESAERFGRMRAQCGGDHD